MIPCSSYTEDCSPSPVIARPSAIMRAIAPSVMLFPLWCSSFTGNTLSLRSKWPITLDIIQASTGSPLWWILPELISASNSLVGSHRESPDRIRAYRFSGLYKPDAFVIDAFIFAYHSASEGHNEGDGAVGHVVSALVLVLHREHVVLAVEVADHV